VQLTFDGNVEAFRSEFVAFLDEHLPAEAEAAERSAVHVAHTGMGPALAAVAVRPRLAAAGQSTGIRWPQRDTAAAVRAPRGTIRRRIYQSFNPQGVGIIAASLLTFGSPEQKRRVGGADPARGDDGSAWDERTGRGAPIWPAYGPRPCGLRRLRGHGQKVWTSGAHDSDVLLPSCAPIPKRRSTRHQRPAHPH